jgi:protein Mpv17
MAQQLVEKRGLDKHDPMRTLRMAGYGGIIFGPAATTWYGVLTKHVNLSSKNGTILARVACDQFLFAPVNMGASCPLYYPPIPFPSEPSSTDLYNISN